MILITTAGNVGSEAARLLVERHVPVRVLVRDSGKAKALADAGAQIAVGDLEVPESIEAMAGVSAVVLVSPAMPAQELNVVASAARAGVEHVVKATNKASADSPIARRRGQTEIEAGLAASGLPHTLLRSNAYMQNTLVLAPVIAKTSSFGSSAGKGLVGMVDVREVRQAGTADHATGKRRCPIGAGPDRRGVEGLQADGDGREMRARVVISTTVAAALGFVLPGVGSAWAADTGGENTFANAQASGGQLTVQAGVTHWTPPGGSAWAKQADSDPPPGKPNPNQPYGCTYTAQPSATATIGVGGAQPGEWVFPECSGPGAVDPMPPVWVTNAQPGAVTVAVDPVVVGEQAVQQLGLGSPSIEMARRRAARSWSEWRRGCGSTRAPGRTRRRARRRGR